MLVMIVLIVGSCLSVFISQNYASVAYLEKRIDEVKISTNADNSKINSQLSEIKGSIKDIDHNILEVYKAIKYQEGRDANN